MVKQDLTGKRFGRLVVLGLSNVRKANKRYWLCRCDCGKLVDAQGNNLVSGNTRSCGCLRKETSVSCNTTHGLRYTRIHNIWSKMKDRCNNARCVEYELYGARGITYCPEWETFLPFYNWAMENGYREDLTIDRIDVNGNYCPENCRWITLEEQQKNRRTTRWYTEDGKTMCLTDWIAQKGLTSGCVYSRLKRGWSLERALNTPIRRLS